MGMARPVASGRRLGTCSAIQPKQGRNVGRNAPRFRQRRRVLGGRLVDDDQPSVDGGAVLGVDRTVDRGGEHDAAALLQPDEGVAPGRGVRPEVRAGDRHQPPAVGETRERRSDVAIGGVGHAAGDVRHRREGRVHQHDARNGGRIEMIVDLRGVEARDGDGRKEGGEQRRPGLGQFVQHERAAGDLGQDGEEAGSGRRLQHAVRRPDGGCGQGREAERASAWRIAGRPRSRRSGGCGSGEGRRSWSRRKAGKPESRLCGKAPFRICAGRGRSRPRRRHRPSSSPRRRRRRRRRKPLPWRRAGSRHRHAGRARDVGGAAGRRR